MHLLETLRIFAETDRQVSFFSCKNMNEEVNKIIEVMVQQIMNHVPDYGDFSPILEFFVNPDSRTSKFVGKYGLKVYKMPKDIVADPRIRYIEYRHHADTRICGKTPRNLPAVSRTLRTLRLANQRYRGSLPPPLFF